MFGSIGFPELLVILTIALLIFGPKKLPEVGRSIGKALREFRKTSDEIKEKIEEEIHAEEFKEIKRDINEITDFKCITSPLEDSPPGKADKTPKDPYKAPMEETSQKKESAQEKQGNDEGKKVSG
jgi:TatA/E family protein of Tat protein translocase